MKTMKNIFISLIIILFIGLSISQSNAIINNSDNIIIHEIENTNGKILSIDKIIADVQVRYYEHYENEVFVKNDSILLHINPNTSEIILYEKNWRDITVDPELFLETNPQIKDFLMKRLVVFPSWNDCGNFYTLSNELEFPLMCWEVFHNNGETILYNEMGKKIGYGIPAPAVEGFSLSGWDEDYGYPWEKFRESANRWFGSWCDITLTETGPLLDVIDEQISNVEVDYFYELAHGDYRSFMPCPNGNYYPSMVDDAIKERQPMKFAFIGSCGGMVSTNKGSFSHAFRKGEMYGTVTIGYYNMHLNPNAWASALNWQNTLFQYMAMGETFKDSFDNACLEWPWVEVAVRFKGDTNISIDNSPPSSPQVNGPSAGGKNKICSFTTNSYDPEGDDIYYMIDWGDNTSSNWLGPFKYKNTPSFNHSWSKNGVYTITCEAKDDTEMISHRSSFNITITNAPENPQRPFGRKTRQNGTYCKYYTSCVDSDGDNVFYLWDWGDGNVSNWIGPFESGVICSWYHSWRDAGEYKIKVKAKDINGVESDWSDSLTISMPKIPKYNTFFQMLSMLLEHYPFLQNILFFIN